MVYDRLMPPKELTLAQIQDIVGRNAISEFLDTFENEVLDFKGEIYRLDEDSQKLELAKDISSFANTRGGFIVLGIKTKKHPEYSAEVSDELRPMPRKFFDEERLRNVARDWIYPPLNDLRITLIASPGDSEKVFAVLEIPENAIAKKPYLMFRAPDDEAGTIKKIAFGYVERVSSSNVPSPIERLQQLLHLGARLESYDSFRQGTEVRLDELNSMLKRLENAVLRQVETDALATTVKREQSFEQRVRIAAKQTGFSDVPYLLLAAFSEPEVRLDSLFSSSKSPLVRTFENPPEFRNMGFDFALHRASEIIQGESRRISIPGYKSMQLSVSGELIVLLLGDEGFLAWASNMRGRSDVPIRINSFVLGEAIYAFAVYVKNIYAFLTPVATTVRLFVGLSDMTRSGKPAVLSSEESSPLIYHSGFTDKGAPDTSRLFSFEVPVNETAERIAFLLRAKIYNWFGFEDDAIPYATTDSDGRKIVNRASLKIANP
jgi:Putative DNA-binding domain